MKRVLVANKFLHHVGGVETYVRWLSEHLPDAGYEVAFFGMKPVPTDNLMQLSGPTYFAPHRSYYGPPAQKVRDAAASVYSTRARRAMELALRDFAPDLVHFQSTCFQLTPSVVRAVDEAGIPSVATAHEYKFVCSNQRLWNDGLQEPCFRCLGRGTAERMRQVLSARCVKGKPGPSLLAVAELPVADAVWRRSRGLVHAPSQFMGRLLNDAHSPVAGRVRYLDLSWGSATRVDRGGARPRSIAYTGRLSREKGVDTLLRAWRLVERAGHDIHLDIYGTGPEEADLRSLAGQLGLRSATFRGRYEQGDLAGLMAATVATVHPSRWDENSPYTVRESLQHGVPAIVTDAGGMPEMVSDLTGRVVPRDDPGALAAGMLAEVNQRRCGLDSLVEAVSKRAVGDADHLQGLGEIYEEAGSAARESRP